MRLFTRLALTALLALPLLATAADPETPDARPDLGLERGDGAGGFTVARVHALARQRDGKLLVGGDFVRAADGSLRSALLRVGTDGRLDPDFLVELASAGAIRVQAIAMHGDAIYIGGRFQQVEGQARNNLARLDRDGNLVADWDAGLLEDDEIFALAAGPEGLYAGGDIASLQRYGLARFSHADGSEDPAWRAPTQVFPTAEPSAGARGRVHVLHHTGQDLIVGGGFGQIAGQVRASVARLSLQAPVAVGDFVSPINGGERIVYDIVPADAGQTLYVAGNFFAGQHDHLMRLDAVTGALDASWRPQPAGAVRALARAGSWLYAGGDFENQATAFLLRAPLAGGGAADANWLPLPNARVRDLLSDPGSARLWVGGDFADIGGLGRNGLARYSFAGEALLFRDGFEAQR